VVVLLLAIIVAAIGVLIYVRATKEAPESIEKKLAPFLEKTTTFLARFGLFPSNPLNHSFNTALSMMRNFIGGTQYRYRLPWILMLGGQSAGKSTLLQGLELSHPIERPQEDILYDKPLCDWWFYDYGVVLDLDGKLVLEPDKTQSNESSWRLFLNLLAHYRPKRALDGIVLTIPVSELTGKGSFSHDDLMLRANYLYDKLWQLQRITGLRVPVYVVVTKCDLLPGFTGLCKALPVWAKSDMFGWSNDKALDSTYTVDWVDEAFSSINLSLFRLQEEIYADDDTTDHRDGIFLLPLAFDQLKEGIRTYINHLFKPSSYHESFFLRGIYFVGDSHIEKTKTEVSSSLTFPWHFTEKDKKEDYNLYFTKDLFEQKVFRELGLARPVSSVLLGNTTVIRFAKGVLAVLAVLGTLGLLRAHEHLQNAKLNLMAVLPQIDVTLEKIHGQDETTQIGRLYFDQQAQTILNAMTQIDVTNILSVFVPPSWFSRLDAKIRQVMVLAYNKVILRSMDSQLNYKAHQIVSVDTLPPLIKQTNTEVDPLKTQQFKRLVDYINNLRTLETTVNSFNSLEENSTLEGVASIIKFLFDYEMPASFFSNDDYYLSALSQAKISPFDFQKYQHSATDKLNKLFTEFQEATFDPNYIVPGLSQLMTALYQFSGARNYTSYDTSVLRDIFAGIDKTISSMQNPGLQWIESDMFYPGIAYENIIQMIAESNFFEDNTAGTLMTMMNQEFITFRKRLADYSSPLFNNETLFVTENGLAVAAPSQGAMTLSDNLRAFFNEPFMAPSQGKSIIVTVPVGAVLLWDTLRLQEAVDLIATYNGFVDSRLLNMPKDLQPLLQKIAQENLANNLVDFVANAEVFNSPTITSGNPFSPEDSILSSVQNYRVAAPYLEKIIVTLRENNANEGFTALKTLITAQVYAPLVKLDNILTEEAPYRIKDNSFNWWAGSPTAAFEAFSVSNITELRNQLALQRDRINYLAQEFAKPLVSFLGKINEEGMPGNLPLVEKWQGIMNALNEYNSKAPGNSVIGLENFILTPLNEVTLKTCAKYTRMTDLLSGTHDFFLSIFADMEEKLQSRCESLVEEKAMCSYKQASQFFNTHLAGKFPFTDGKDLMSPDASPEDIQTFFQMMEGQFENTKAAFASSTGLGVTAQKGIEFIQQMEKIKEFFGGFLASSEALSTPAFVFDVKFRVNKAQEAHGNEVIDWNVLSHDMLISMRSQSHKGYWMVGDPVTVVLRWAANSPLQPLEGNLGHNFDVEDGKAIFSYNGQWALLRLFQQHRDIPSGLIGLGGESPSMLRFEVPLAQVSQIPQKQPGCAPKAKVFLSIDFSPLVKTIKSGSLPKGDTSECATGEEIKVKMQQKLPLDKVVDVPHFPSHAPELTPVRGVTHGA
jgi:type VI secretion system protein ImpL